MAARVNDKRIGAGQVHGAVVRPVLGHFGDGGDRLPLSCRVDISLKPRVVVRASRSAHYPQRWLGAIIRIDIDAGGSGQRLALVESLPFCACL